ncbi:MAG: aldose 1-epimerase family protein [Clostridium sp.]|nr:aldose 1-epimerase family protein [Clostridium sp.]MCM1547539.1 aldose 1-epimerase family protein [Ruminococcus sp.]
MIYELKNNNLKLTADTFGAELHSINLNGLEYLWQCGDSWKRYAPILFPFICSPKNGLYNADGKQYKMNANHGFARDSEFELYEKTENSISFKLTENERTLSQYPYKFTFIVKYSIYENTVKVEHYVSNNDSRLMYFYIGGHPAFNCPLENGESFTDYYVEYESNEHVTRNVNGKDEVVMENGNILDMTRELFDYDSLVLPYPNSKSVSLKSRKSQRYVTVDFPESKCITVWSPTGNDDASFVCLEPWTSVPTYFDDDEPDIEKKAHAISLAPEKTYGYSYTITVH